MVESSLRALARERFGRRCGYCGVHEDSAGSTLTVDHYQPRARAGGDEPQNLIYCCERCNTYKGSYWHETNPPHIRLLHPGLDDLSIHVREEDSGFLSGLTTEGEFFVRRLRLNRPQLVAHRLDRHNEAQSSRELSAAQEDIRRLEKEISRLNAALLEIEDELKGR